VLQHITLPTQQQLLLLEWPASACMLLFHSRLQTACLVLMLPLGSAAPLNCLSASWPGSRLLLLQSPAV
jgi:hypothetical protein